MKKNNSDVITHHSRLGYVVCSFIYRQGLVVKVGLYLLTQVYTENTSKETSANFGNVFVIPLNQQCPRKEYGELYWWYGERTRFNGGRRSFRARTMWKTRLRRQNITHNKTTRIVDRKCVVRTPDANLPTYFCTFVHSVHFLLAQNLHITA